jgi:hypothetical protein
MESPRQSAARSFVHRGRGRSSEERQRTSASEGHLKHGRDSGPKDPKELRASETKIEMACGARFRPAIVTAVLTAITCLSAPSAARGDCSVGIVLRGSEPARSAIVAELVRAGIDMTPRPGCAAEDVVVTADATGLTLIMTDAYGRVTHRTVTDVEAAGAVIESRTRPDLLAPLLPQGEGMASQKGDGNFTEQTAPTGRPTTPSIVQLREVQAAGHSVTMFVASEYAMGSDESGWAGLSVSGCVTLGPICLGTLIRFWHDLDAAAESAEVIRKRNAGEVAVSLDAPFTRRGITFSPGMEIGVGWVHMGGFGGHPAMVDDNEFDHGDVIAGVHVTVSFPVSQHWSIESGLGFNLSLFAHQAPFVIDGVMLPGEPLAYGLASVGLRYGGL